MVPKQHHKLGPRLQPLSLQLGILIQTSTASDLVWCYPNQKEECEHDGDEGRDQSDTFRVKEAQDWKKKVPTPETKAERLSQLSEENTVGNILMLDLNFHPCKTRVHTSLLFEPTLWGLSVLAKERQKF